MARRRKYKNVKLEQTELTSTPIGAFENRKKSSIGAFFIIGVFVLVVFYLPEISEYINNYLETKEVPIIKPSTPTPKPTVPDPIVDNENLVAFTSDITVKNDEITVSNFKVDPENLTISYDITNNTNKSMDIAELNYYLEIFNNEQTLVKRVKLTKSVNLNSGAFTNITTDINAEAATTINFIAIVKKSTNDYPLLELTEDGEKKSSLICTYNNEKITYNFQSGLLKEVVSDIKYLNTDTDYQTKYESNVIEVSKYNNTTGVTSSIFNENDGYSIKTIVNLSSASRMYIFNANTFKLDTEAKVVKFEIEAEGFTCEQ